MGPDYYQGGHHHHRHHQSLLARYCNEGAKGQVVWLVFREHRLWVVHTLASTTHHTPHTCVHQSHLFVRTYCSSFTLPLVFMLYLINYMFVLIFVFEFCSCVLGVLYIERVLRNHRQRWWIIYKGRGDGLVTTVIVGRRFFDNFNLIERSFLSYILAECIRF